jgi:hypothetical protein
VIKTLLRWIFAILFGLAAVPILFVDFFTGLVALAGALLLSPPGGRIAGESIAFFNSAKAQVLAAVAIILVAFASFTPPSDHKTSLHSPDSQAFSCETGVSADGAVVQVIGAQGHDLLTAPGGNKIVNEKATSIIGSPVYQSIDNSTKVQVQCLDGTWARVQITHPAWLTAHGGWVPISALALDVKPDGQRQFTEGDFHWDADTAKAKQLIVNAVNRIQREDKRCSESIYPASVAKSSSKTKTASNPVFFVTCGDGINAVNVYFDAARANDHTPFTPPVHIDRATAVNLCESYAKSNATHPSTVSFSRFRDLAVSEHANGRTTVVSTFTAKNSFNLELTYSIRCLLDGGGFIEGVINES